MPGVEKLPQTDFTSSKPDFTEKGVKFEILIIGMLRFKSTKEMLPSILRTAFSLPCIHHAEQGRASSISYGSLGSLEKRLLSHMKLKSKSTFLW